MVHRAKKSLGQHFLRSKSAIYAIVSAGNVVAGDTVLEIGPGEGVLTDALLATNAHVVAVEKDRDLIPILEERFAEQIKSKQLTLIEADILDFDPEKHGLKKGEYKLVANIPYYITGAIFEKFLSEKCSPSCMVVLIQKEVATRIVARDNKESILSISVKAFGTPKLTAKVPASAFRPAPKVDSAVLAVYDISQHAFTHWDVPETEAIHLFFKVVRAGFAHKRKLLARNLEAVAEKAQIQKSFLALDLSPNTRAEDLQLSTWVVLAKTFLTER
ncbi:MAG: 16S rRNA (adenine(1518)-N(6)/adenine(1519)-N(6))-dimethyltransferase RsmA [bacterium]